VIKQPATVTNEVKAMIRQTVLPFKLEKTHDLVTSNAGLALLGEFAHGMGLLKSLDRYLPKPGSGAGYAPSEHLSLSGIAKNNCPRGKRSRRFGPTVHLIRRNYSTTVMIARTGLSLPLGYRKTKRWFVRS
jgi:hypothetical protein